MSSEREPEAQSKAFAQRVLTAIQDAGRFTDAEVAAANGPSDSYMTLLRKAADGYPLPQPRRHTQKRIEAAARWAAGSAMTVWEGGDPTPLVSLEKKSEPGVGGDQQTPGQFVGGTGERVDEGRRGDDQVLQAITAMSASIDQLLAGQRGQSDQLHRLSQDSGDARARLAALEDAQRELSERVAQLEKPGP